MECNVRHQKLKKKKKSNILIFQSFPKQNGKNSSLEFLKIIFLKQISLLTTWKRTFYYFQKRFIKEKNIYRDIYVCIIHIYILQCMFYSVQHCLFDRLFFFHRSIFILGCFSEFEQRLLFQFNFCKKIQHFFFPICQRVFLLLLFIIYFFFSIVTALHRNFLLL